MKKLPNGFAAYILIIIIALVVFAGLVFVYFYTKPVPIPGIQQSETQTTQGSASEAPVAQSSPATDETASWIAYTNTKYGYSLKYPKSIFTGEVNIEEKSNGDIALNYFKLPLSESSAYPHSINIYTLSPSQTLDEYISNIHAGDGPKPTITVTDISIGGKSGKKILGIPSANGQVLILIPNNDQLLVMTLDPYVPGSNQNEDGWIKTFDLLLTTVKFSQ